MNFVATLWKAFESLTPARKLSLAVTAVLTAVTIAALIHFTHQADFRVLFSNLSSEDAAQILTKIKERKIPHKISAAGDIVSVPSDQVSELRLELAAEGLPQGGGVGFEIFDSKTLGATEFQQQLNYRRALQGELARTINGLDEILQSRVHIVIPKESLFIEEQKKPTASVTVKLKPGKSLNPSQVEGITHLVAAGVEGLDPENVMLLDSRGNILSDSVGQTRLAKMTGSQVQYQRGIEKDLATRIQSMLENVVGAGKAVVRVSAELDFRMTEQTEEKYDPEEPVVRSMQRQTEKTLSGAPAGISTGEENTAEHEKANEIINYEINRVVNKTVLPVGEIQTLSIAVLVDGLYAKNAEGAEAYQPRSRQELDAIEDLVRKSTGFNANRGDQITVTSMPFKKVDGEDGFVGETWRDKLAGFLPLIKFAMIFAIAALVFLFVVRPLIHGLSNVAASEIRHPQLTGETAAPQLAEFPSGARAQGPMNEIELTRQLAAADSKKFAELLRNWLK